MRKEGRKRAHSCDTMSQRYGVRGHSRRRERRGRLCAHRPLHRDGGMKGEPPARKPHGATLVPTSAPGTPAGRTSSCNGGNRGRTPRRALIPPPAAAGRHAVITRQVPQQLRGRLMAEKGRESNTQTSSLPNTLRFAVTRPLLGENRRVLELGAGLLSLSAFGIRGRTLPCCGVSCALEDHLGPRRA